MLRAMIPPATPGRTGSAAPDAIALARERSLVIAAVLDWAVIIPYLVIGFGANSLTMVGESIRGGLMALLELVLLVMLRRIHRNRITGYDYGVAKLEQFANLSIGVAMGAAGLWLLGAAAMRWDEPPDQAGFGLVVGAGLAVLNLALNAAALRALWLAGKDGTSAIMTVQIRSRVVKLVSSAIVALCIAMNAAGEVLGGAPEWLAPLAEVVGSGFVGLVMVQLAVSLWRESLPHLLDRSLDEARQAAINRSLARHFDEYEALLGVKSRIAGKQAIIDITLGFDATRAIGEIQHVADAIGGELRALIPDALVTVTPVALFR